MELREYWSIVRRRWWLPLALTALVTALSLLQLRPWQPPTLTYQASMRLLVGVMPASDADITSYDPRYYAWQTSEYLVDDFTEVVHSELFAQHVSKRLADLKLTVPPDLIRGSAATGKLHRILSITLTWPDQAQLHAISAAIVAELTENSTFYFRQLGTENTLATLLDQPTIQAVGPSLRQRLELPLRIGLAFLAGILLLFLLDYLDTTVRNRQELETLGFTVLGEIPRHSNRITK
ncbi:MAG: hypothetical protein R3C14_04805 [Caldilineaceae bacterium]